MEKVAKSTRLTLLLGVAAVIYALLNSDNPIMRYLNVPAMLFYSQATLWDNLYALLVAGVILGVMLGLYRFYQGSLASINRFKWGIFLGILCLVMVVLVLHDLSLLFLPLASSSQLPENFFELQYFDLKNAAVIAVLNLALNTFQLVTAYSLGDFLAKKLAFGWAWLLASLTFMVTTCLLLRGPILPQVFPGFILGLILTHHALKRGCVWDSILAYWLGYEILVLLENFLVA